MKSLSLIVSIILITIQSTIGQKTKLIEAVIGDVIVLDAETSEDDIQWQVSINKEDWEDIEGENSTQLNQSVSSIPSFYRAKIYSKDCGNQFSEVVSILSSESKLWSDPETWGGSLPKAGQDVVINDYIELDIDTPPLGKLIINGQLGFARSALSLTAENIIVNGKLEIGTEANPIEDQVIINLTGTNNEIGASDRGIMVAGTLELHGATPAVLWTKLNHHLPAGAKNLVLAEPVTWETSGEIVMAPTDYYEAGGGTAVTQKTSIASVDGTNISIVDGSNSHRWGLLQYATPSGMSTSPGATRIKPPLPNSEASFTPTVLDERGEIGYLKRNIIIQSPEEDQLWSSFGFGVHIMIMPGGIAHAEGVEIKRGGQRGHKRRYPWHWHNLSYQSPDGIAAPVFSGDANGQYFRKNVINESTQRGVVIHGTNGVDVSDNIIYHIEGHGIFTEDAVERRNVISGNLVLHIRNPVWDSQLKNHEQVGLHDGGPSGFWLSNPDNIIINNVAADCMAFGFWMAYPDQPWGDHQNYVHPNGFEYNPNRELFGVFDNNTAHSNRRRGFMLDLAEISNDGDVGGTQYYSTVSGTSPQWPYDDLRSFSMTNCTIYKSGHNGFWDRSTRPITRSFVSADNCGRFFAGAGNGGIIEQCLVVGTSLNHEMNGTNREALGDADFYDDNLGFAPSAFATYHHTFLMRDNVIMEFPLIDGERSGVFASEDYYIRAVEKGHVRNVNNLIINAHPGYKAKAPYNYMTFSSAIWDPNGYWGEPGEYFVYDDPFLTHGKTTTTVGENSTSTGGVMAPGPYYGFRGFVLYGVGDELPMNQTYMDLWPIHVIRRNDDLEEVATWSVDEAQRDWTLQHMRDFATSPDAIYELTFPGQSNPTDFTMLVDNMLEDTDTQVMGIQFDGNLQNIQVSLEAYGHRKVYSPVNSLNEVRNSAGEVYWQDTGNNKLWVKLKGGVWEYYTTDFDNNPSPTFEDLAYETLTFSISPVN